MKRILIGVCALAVGFTMTSGALAQAPNNPVFSLWVTEIYDTWGGPNKCTVCPTQNVPSTDVAPGDIIRLEAYLSSWDAQVGRGFCNGDPAHNGANSCSPTGSTSGCVGKHCANTGLTCVNDLQCAGSVCLDNLCQYFPRIGAYQWTLLGQSLNSGSAGQLTPFNVPCIADDCDLLSDGQCACAHFYSFPHECTCVNPVNAACDAVTSLCGFQSTRFIEKTRSDYLFFGKSASEIIGFPTTQDIELAGYLNNPVFDAVIDASPSIKKYLGTVLLEASPTAAGIFTVTFLKNPGNTLVSDANGIDSSNPAVFNSYIYEDLIINFIGGPQPCSSIVGATPSNCEVDGRQPHDIGSAVPAQGINTIDLTLDALCDANTLNTGSFSIAVNPAGGAVPTIASVSGSGNTATLTLSSPIPPQKWTCITLTGAPVGNDVCVGFLPGDVDANLTASTADFTAAINSLNGMVPEPLIGTDTNRSTIHTAEDLVRLADLANGGGAYNPLLNTTLPACPP